ncbi:PadR family transcriptional regulator [Aquirhabdus sp.]|uniref:PadR family transcriptional regulator n=1 Tax=Aquirhabdus sp. TaxID=2824160 RepID=UPI00396CD411
MSLPHALMVSLLEKSCSGYDLAQRFGKSIGYFWQASHQQIYRELAKMEENGWVKSEAEDGSKTRKRTYHVLDEGVTELKRWVAESIDPPQQREAFFVRLRADAVMGPLGLEGELLRRIHIHEQKLKTYRVIEQRDFLSVKNQPQGQASRALRIQHMLLKAGILYEESSLAWSKETYKILTEE